MEAINFFSSFVFLESYRKMRFFFYTIELKIRIEGVNPRSTNT